MADSEQTTTFRRRAVRVAAVLGIVLGALCPLLPPRYHHACATIAGVFNLHC